MLTIPTVSINVNVPVRARGGAPGPTPTIGRWRHAADGELTMTAKRLLDRQSQVHRIAVACLRLAGMGENVGENVAARLHYILY